MSACAECGQENPEGFRFCGSCGSPLAEVGPVESEERKLVSVLFVDLVGHTAASDRADPEDVRARLRPYRQFLKREIEPCQGRCLLGLSQLGEAVVELEDARAIFSGLGARPLVGKVDGWLTQAAAG